MKSSKSIVEVPELVGVAVTIGGDTSAGGGPSFGKSVVLRNTLKWHSSSKKLNNKYLLLKQMKQCFVMKYSNSLVHLKPCMIEV